MSEQPKQYKRFSASERLEHVVLIISFTMLGVTGLIQRYATDAAIARDLIDLMGGIESVRLMHRFFAVMLIGGTIYHGGAVTYNIFVKRVRFSMLPTMTDVRNVWETLTYNFGLRKEPPKMPRYNFAEKAEYLALVWGTIIMIITGFMLWNPIATTSLLPGVVIPIAQLAHSAEAVLAVLSILIWHFYHVHIKQLNRSMFTGNISHEAMEEEHALELEAIEKGQVPPPIPADVMAKRMRYFYPYATVVTVLLVGGLVWFVTFEDTAITTVERQPIGDIAAIDPQIGDATLGEALWASQPCQACHGTLGEGVPPIPPINTATIDFEHFFRSVRVGPADMPAFSTVNLSDEDIAHLYAYITQAE